MSNKKLTGEEPAMPQDYDTVRQGMAEKEQCTGLTIRQHFAAMAMQGMLAACNGCTGDHLGNLASCSVKAADALIEQLNK